MLQRFWNDECGAILSAELVLIMTIAVIGMIVGLSELAYGVVQELNDVGDAIGAVNQSYAYTGFHASKGHHGRLKAFTSGSQFFDVNDECDNNQCDITCSHPLPEGPKFHR
jgi:Flp pilus assembly pilin Flp